MMGVEFAEGSSDACHELEGVLVFVEGVLVFVKGVLVFVEGVLVFVEGVLVFVEGVLVFVEGVLVFAVAGGVSYSYAYVVVKEEPCPPSIFLIPVQIYLEH